MMFVDRLLLYFKQSYVTCTVGVGWVGYIMICYGTTNAAFSLFWGRLAKSTGRTFIFASGTIINLIIVVVLLTWLPKEEQLWVMFVLAALWGVADAVWQTQINGKTRLKSTLIIFGSEIVY